MEVIKSFVSLTIIGDCDRILISSLIKVGSVCVCSGFISLSSAARHAYQFEVTNRGFFFMGSSSDERLHLFEFSG